MVLDLDKLGKRAVLHQIDCPKLPFRYGTVAKPKGMVGRCGGWFDVASVSDARLLVAVQAPQLSLSRCACCAGVPEQPKAAPGIGRTPA